MSGRGRGRGIAALTFNIEALGLSRGSLPDAALGPRPLFPDVEYKPVPLKTGEDEEYMLALKQEIRATMKRLPYNIPKPQERPDVERYKEKYMQASNEDKHDAWTPDWNRLPKELMPRKKKPKTKPQLKKAPNAGSKKEVQELLTKLEELEKKDEKSDEEKGENAENDQEEEGEEVEEEYEEEEVEEENDYIASYFEDGDDYGGGSDDNMDEATY